jgi:hypothetical protein
MTMAVAAPVETLSAGEKRHLAALERRVEQGLQTFKEVGFALLEIRDSRLYRETHTSFEAYALDRWKLDKTRAYQFIGAAEVVKLLGEPEELTNEAQTRELVSLFHDDPEAVQTVWDLVEERVAESGTPVTAAVIRQARRDVVNPSGPPPPTLTERIMAEFARLTTLVVQWQGAKPAPRRADKVAVKAALDKLTDLLG